MRVKCCSALVRSFSLSLSLSDCLSLQPFLALPQVGVISLPPPCVFVTKSNLSHVVVRVEGVSLRPLACALADILDIL
jgi:hypothetical protein